MYNGSKNFKNTSLPRRYCGPSSTRALTDWERLHQPTSTVSVTVILTVSLGRGSLGRRRVNELSTAYNLFGRGEVEGRGGS